MKWQRSNERNNIAPRTQISQAEPFHRLMGLWLVVSYLAIH